MSVGRTFVSEAGYRRHRPVPRDGHAAAALARIHAETQAEPLILPGRAAGWPALQRWNRDYIVDRCGDTRVRPSIGLPDHGVPYRELESTFRREMTLRAFFAELAAINHCYVDQQAIADLPGLSGDLPIRELVGDRPCSELNLWIGRGTKSGLHLDTASNFVVMIRGSKEVVLAAPREAGRLYPFPDSVTKSRLDVERPDFERFPRARDVELWVGRLDAGDVLFIPTGWWHHLASPADDYHISVNCWFGRDEALHLYASLLARLGPRYAGQALADFVAHGVLGRPFTRMNYRPLPDGVMLYEILRRTMREALGRAEARP